MRNLIFNIIYYLGIGHLLLFLNRVNYKIPILLYHRVSENTDKYWKPLTPGEFEMHINFLSKKYRFISLDELFTKSSNELKRSCAIVFDDAFKDFQTCALPILEKYNVPVTMFVPVKNVTDNEIIWTSRLDNSFKCTSKKELSFTINNKIFSFPLTDEELKISTAFTVQKLLIELPDEQRIKHLEIIIDMLGHANDTTINIMSWDDINNSKNHVSYHSHSMTHPALSNIDSDTILRYEINDSKSIIESKIKNEVKYLAYPIGKYNS
ncbi:MAG TPA: polysaccharide deacetylase family protein, partial [Bacteroidia bacterium]